MQRERLTITLDAELLQGIDSLIDKAVLRNRSQAIEHLLKEGVGLHQLTQAFLFLEQWEENQLDNLLTILLKTPITQLFLVLGSSEMNRLPGLQASIMGKSSRFQITPTPADFGSGGAVILQKEQLATPFLLCWVNERLRVPSNLINGYLFHRRQGSVLTQLIDSEAAQEYRFSQIAFAEPELLQHIPAGIASLTDPIFPDLAKAGKVSLYANQ